MSMQIRKINIGTRDTVHVVALSLLGATRAQAIDVSANGTLYMADYTRDVVLKVFENGAVNGAIIGHISTPGNVNADGITKTGVTDARTTNPAAIAVGQKAGHLYLGDGGAGWQIRRMSGNGTISFFSGNFDFQGDAVNALDGDFDNTKARFKPANNGMGMAVDRHGTLYVADTGNNKIKKIWEDGRSTTMAGLNLGGFLNATGTAALFSGPKDVCVDNQGNVFVADTGNFRIRKVTESGVVTTLSGIGTSSFLDGNGTTATWGSPERICMDPSNNFVYVLDRTNSAIRKVDMTGNVNTFCHYNPSPSGLGDICVDNSGFLYVLENNS